MHFHPPNADKVNVKEAIDSLRNEAKTSCEPIRNVVNFLSESDVWMADGSFKSIPPLFSQLYTIHACKKNATYSLKPNLKPSMLMVDFENAFITTFKEEFPTVVIRGYFFHFTQCVWKKIQNSGLQTKYGQDSKFALQVRLLCSLSFIPPNKVIEAFDELIESEYYIQNEELLESIIMYFEDTWIGRLGRRGRRGAH
ncbi:Uncharacterized protein FWK35_00031174, partial [Aphis craccivora]